VLDHVSITVSDIGAAERARPIFPERVYTSVRKGAKPEEALGRHWCFKAKWRTATLTLALVSVCSMSTTRQRALSGRGSLRPPARGPST
jgi:hypothetical protein